MRSIRMLRHGWVVCLAILFLCSTGARTQSGQATGDVLVLAGGTVVSPERSGSLTDSVIVVRGNRIESVGKAGSVQYPANARVLNVNGKYVIPGFIDTHLHFEGWSTELHLASGVTSGLDHGGNSEWKVAWRDGVAKGKIRGFRMYLSNIGINGRIHGGPQGYEGLGFLDMWGNGIGYDGMEIEDLQEVRAMDANRADAFAGSVEQARELIRRLVRNGSDGIKVHHNLSRDVIKVIVEEAHRANIPVVGHRFDARENAEFGMDFIEHSSPVAIATITDKEKFEQLKAGKHIDPHYLMDPAAFPGLIQKLVKANVYFNPTLSGGWRGANGRQREYASWTREFFSKPTLKYAPAEGIQKLFNDFEMLDRLSPEQARAFEEGYKKLQRFMKEFSQAGGKLLAGVDSNLNTGIPGIGMPQEMELMVDAGVTPLEAFKSATIYGAQLMRKEKDLGTLEVGKLADLVVLGGDPLADIRNTRRVETVIIDGKVVDITLHADYKPPILEPSEAGRTGLRNNTPARMRLNGSVPASAVEGSQDLQIAFRGKFLPTSKVVFNGTELKTVFENPRSLKATVPGTLLQRVGTYPIQLTSPMFGGGVDKSNTIYFIVKYR